MDKGSYHIGLFPGGLDLTGQDTGLDRNLFYEFTQGKEVKGCI